MKTNLASLMSIITLGMRELNQSESLIRMYSSSEFIEELDGRRTVISDNKKDFDRCLDLYNNLSKRIIYLKSIQFEKNNEFKLSDGRTIEQAIAENKILNSKIELYTNLIQRKWTTTRVSENVNSYFRITEANYDYAELRSLIDSIKDEIKETNYEISKLNSIEFEIDPPGVND